MLEMIGGSFDLGQLVEDVVEYAMNPDKFGSTIGYITSAITIIDVAGRSWAAFRAIQAVKDLLKNATFKDRWMCKLKIATGKMRDKDREMLGMKKKVKNYLSKDLTEDKVVGRTPSAVNDECVADARSENGMDKISILESQIAQVQAEIAEVKQNQSKTKEVDSLEYERVNELGR